MEEQGSVLALLIGNGACSLHRFAFALDKAGIEVTVVPDCPQGLALLEEKAYHLVLVLEKALSADYREIRRLRQVTNAPLVLLGDRKADATTWSRVLQAGIDDYVSMSASTAEVVARARSLIRRSKDRGHPDQRKEN